MDDYIIGSIKAGNSFGVSPTFDLDDSENDLIQLGETMEINGRPVSGPCRIVRGAKLEGASITPYPTDPNTNVNLISLSRHEPYHFELLTLTKETVNMADECNDEKKEEELSEEGTDGTTENPYPGHPELVKFIDAFGKERGTDFYLRGLSMEEAEKEDYQELKAQMSRLSETEEKEESPEQNKESSEDAPEDEEKKEELKKLSKKNLELEKKVEDLSKKVLQLSRKLVPGEQNPVGASNGVSHPLSGLAITAQRFREKINN